MHSNSSVPEVVSFEVFEFEHSRSAFPNVKEITVIEHIQNWEGGGVENFRHPKPLDYKKICERNYKFHLQPLPTSSL